MARFEFRLGAVQDLRRNERDQKRAELAAALARARELAESGAALEAEWEQQRHRVRKALAGTIDVEQLRAAGEDEAELVARRAQILAAQQTAAEDIERCRAALAAAEGQLCVLDNLRQRQQEAFRRNELRADAHQADESAGRAAALVAAGSQSAGMITAMRRVG